MDAVYFGNTVMQWSIALGVLIGTYVLLSIMKVFIIHKLHILAEKTNNQLDDMVSGFLKRIPGPVLLVVGLFFAARGVDIPENITRIIDAAVLIVVVSQAISLLEEIIIMVLTKQLQKEDSSAKLPSIFRIAARIALWSIGLLMILSNLGIDVTSLVAGLGIGGLAISLALQSILSDLFASFSIAVDKPFEIGDTIIIGEHQGTVKHIGLKTTRITSLGGEEIVISNAELTTARVQNFKKMQRRRIAFQVGVTYDTPHDVLSRVNEIMKEVISTVKNTEFNRSHFFEFGDSNLVFEVVYFMTTNDYALYMEAQQAINLGIHEQFEKEGIEMAYPTQTLFVKQEAT